MQNQIAYNDVHKKSYPIIFGQVVANWSLKSSYVREATTLVML